MNSTHLVRMIDRKPKVWASFQPPEAVLEYLRERTDFKYNQSGALATRALMEENISGVQGLFVTLRDVVDAELIDRAPDLRVIANLAVGFDNIDVSAATKRGIWVTNTPDVLTSATADLAWALLLAVARRIAEGDRMVRSGRYCGWRHDLLLGTELAGKTLGIWGAGRIGQAIGRRAVGFDVNIIYNNRSRKLEFERNTQARYVEFDELLNSSDFLILAMPLNDSTKGRIGRHEFELMKPGAILVNVARGALIQEKEMIAALRSHSIAGAGLDVYVDTQGIQRELGDLDHVVLTPHIGSATHETRAKMAFLAAKNITDALNGRSPENAVNREEILRRQALDRAATRVAS